MSTHFVCVPCQLQLVEPYTPDYVDVTCPHCKDVMERGMFCEHCGVHKATHDELCLTCTAVCVIDRVFTIDELPESWRKEVSDEVCAEVAYREKCRKERAEKARAELTALIAMCGLAHKGLIELPEATPNFLRIRQAG